MDHTEAANWTRHFDNLLWEVTSIFTAGIGALVAYSYSNFDIAMSLAGVFLSILPVYFAASFRELRKRVSTKIDPDLTNIIKQGRTLHQWEVFVSIYIVFECLWIWLLIKNVPELQYYWLGLGIVVFIIIVILTMAGRVAVHEDINA